MTIQARRFFAESQIFIVCCSLILVCLPTKAHTMSSQEQYERAKQYHQQGDEAQSCDWLEKAAQQGHKDAQNKTGLCYQHGYGGTKDLKKAAYWYTKAADQGDRASMSNLAGMLAEGNGIAKDCRKAVEYFRQTADFIGQSSFGLGLIYQNGCDSVAPNMMQAAKFYEKSAEQGYSDGQSNIAWLYANGRGVPKDFEKACYWATIASMQGNQQGKANAEIFCRQISGSQAGEVKRRAAQFSSVSGSSSIGRPPVQQYSQSGSRQKQPDAGSSSSGGRRWKKAE